MQLARGDFERAGDFESLGRVLNDLAIEHLIGGELAQGQDLLESAIAAARKAGAPPTIMLHNLGQLATFRGDPAKGEAYLREVVADRRREGNPFRVGEVLAAHAEALDDRDEAIASLDEAATMLPGRRQVGARLDPLPARRDRRRLRRTARPRPGDRR